MCLEWERVVGENVVRPKLTLFWFFQAQTVPSQTPASAAPVLMVPPAQWGRMADLPVPVHLATRVEAAKVT